MNFTEFYFWWYLLLASGLVLAAKSIGKRALIWSDEYDRVALMLISLALFYITVPRGFGVFALDIILNYAMIRIIRRLPVRYQRAATGIAIAINAVILIHFKYMLFLLNNVSKFMTPRIGWTGHLARTDTGPGYAPLGISFYTFQMISFLVDIIKSNDQYPVNFIDYVNCVAFFPKVIAGPIERWRNFYGQMRTFRIRFSPDNIDNGLKWLSMGFFMKFVIADNLALFIHPEDVASAWSVIVSTYLFGFKLYFDFAGYNFISIGIANMIGVGLSLNFISPYLSGTIQEFWRRWNVTLMEWFKDYIYIPLGGSRTGLVYCNIFIVFLISGLWHGANWNYILWGAYHGALMVVYRWAGVRIRIKKALGWLITFNSAMFGWLFFMELDTSRLLMKLKTIINPAAYSMSSALKIFKGMTIPELATLVIVLIFAFTVFILELTSMRRDSDKPYGLLLSGAVPYVMLFLSILCSARSSARFVYFNF